jgi:TOMM system kinase/cyclase fusion protein
MVHAPAPALALGSVFQRKYEVLSELGSGSFGRVYRARQLSTGQDVAIKILRLLWAETAEEIRTGVERFRREMRLCVELFHPNIVPLIDSDESEDGVLYAVFQFIPGETLKDLLAREGRLRLAEAVHLMTQVLDALSCAHERGIVHRDLKPENIMVTRTGARRNALVLDFGLGGFSRDEDRALRRLTATREMMGTPCYAAPEQLRGEPPSARSDLYSWGLIFLECLTGELAVGGASAQEVILKQLGPEPIPVPAWLRDHPVGGLLQSVTLKQGEKREVSAEKLLAMLTATEPPESPRASEDEGEPSDGTERRQLSVVSCRFTVVSGEGETPDVEDIDQLLHSQHAMCAELARRGGGRVAGVMADRVLLVFGYPQAREDDARRAARTALQIAADVERSVRPPPERGARLEVRIGVHTGLVIVHALRQAYRRGLAHLLGLTPQIAAQMDELAAAGEVLVSVDTQRLLRGYIDSEPAGQFQFPQLSRSLGVFRLQRAPLRRVGLETIQATAETPLVGRERQLSQVLDAWAGTEAGGSAALFIQGEPGIGKSRLVRELRHRVAGGGGWLESRCVPESQDTPLAPFVDLLGAVEEPLEAMLERYGFDLAESMPLFASLLSRPADSRYPPLGLSPERQKEQTLNALLSLLLRMAEAQPLAFVLEDLQWADPTTIELVNLLVRELRTLQAVRSPEAPRLCAILTARPDFNPPWPVGELAMLQLTRLSERDVEEMIRAGLAQAGSVPKAVVDEVVRRTDGIPLFVEEVTRVLAESGALAEAAERVAAGGSPLEIPGTLRDLLTARLDGLSRAAHETAQLAGVLGREFRYEVLRAVSDKHETGLREDLAELAGAGLIFQRRSARDETYVFRHALLRDAAYESLVRAARQPLHHRVAATLRERFPDVEQNRPEILAHHFERGGQTDAAVDYWHRAGSRALHRAAYQEAFTLLQRGLVLLESRPPSPQRASREVELLSTLGAVLISTRGYSTPEVEQTFARAWKLSTEMGGEIPSSVLYGFWGVQITRSSREGTAALIPRFREIAEHSSDPVAVLTASACLGAAHYWEAELEKSHCCLARGRQLFDSEPFQRFAQTFGYGVGLYSHAYGQLTLWMLGFPDQADTVRRELLAIAERVRDPYCSAVGLAFGMTLAHDRDEPEVELDLADRLVALSTEQRLPVWLAIGMIGRGGALARRGEAGDAVEPLSEGLQSLQRVGVLCSYSHFLTYLADAQLRAGNYAEALATLEESLSLCGTLVARAHEPELLRLQGELLLRRDGLAGDRAPAVESCYRRALALARSAGGKSYELRVSLSLARLWREQGRGCEARALLESAYGWFTEGFDTPDLRAAHALLAELR